MNCRQSKCQRAAFIALALLSPLLLAACPKKHLPSQPGVRVSRTDLPPERLSPIAAAFNGERALDHVRKQIEFGPRPPASPALERTRSYIIDQLRSFGLHVSLDEFVVTTPRGDKKMVNITGEVPGSAKPIILIASHYDTKQFPDMQFVGANDPAASVGTLLEIGRVLGSMKDKPRLAYRLVFFDGEEAFCEGWDDCGTEENPDNTYGSRRYVAQLRATNELRDTRALILLDMIGYKKLELGRDTMSTSWLQDLVWETGRELGYDKVFIDQPEGVGGDDHEPFLSAGIDAVDLIQLSGYPYWHRADDTLDKISAQSMKIVGETVLASLPKIADRIVK